MRGAEEGAPPGEQRLFALKRLRKDHVVQKRQQEHVLMEKKVLLQSRCPFIVRWALRSQGRGAQAQTPARQDG